jgi:anti-sigma B factor antagonist
MFMTADILEFRPHPSHAQIGLLILRGHITGGPQAVELASKMSSFTAQGGRHIVIDMASIDLINSSGLGMLVSALTSMRKLGGSVKLAAVPVNVLHLLEITRLNTVFELFPSVDDAVAKAVK